MLVAAAYNEPFYSVVAQVIPFLMGLLFFESRLLKPTTRLTMFTFYVPLVILAAAEANALEILYAREPPEDIQRNVVVSGLIFGIGSLVLTPLTRLAIDRAPDDPKQRQRVMAVGGCLTPVLAILVGVVLFFGDPLVTLSWLALSLIPLSIAASQLTNIGYRKSVEDKEKRASGEDPKAPE